uniref:Uncharacterized protein n=1 Tax=Alexandrium catenella TaxID=2925 RepID=A0A7S1WVY9_ALECA|mmetsp:Transcript_9512/g.25820  ORF Transcript_9512/g.25820 Transcript_9512/m.25820 type:complete len:254 (-) Transcript_9512:91-852(-)
MALEAQSAKHPYDPAYGIMKTMQAELNELRSALHAEQQQRTREVAELRREVIDLQARLSQQYAEQSQQHQTVSCALTNETALRGRALEKLRSEVGHAIERAEEVESLKTLQATQFGKLATELKTQKKERQESHKDLESRLRGEISERKEQCDKIIEDLTNHKAVAEANLTLDREKLDYLTHNVQLAGDLLTNGIWESMTAQNAASTKAFTMANMNQFSLGSTGSTFAGISQAATRPTTQATDSSRMGGESRQP